MGPLGGARRTISKGRGWGEQIPTVALSTTGVLLVGSVAAFMYGFSGADRWQLLALGLLALAVVIWPFARIRSLGEVVSVWGIVVINVAFGITARSVYIATGTPDEQTIQEVFLLGHTTDYFLWPALLLVIGLLITTITYFFVSPSSRRPPFPQWLQRYRVEERRVYIVGLVLIGAGLIAAAIFVTETGGLDLSHPSMKRASASGLGYVRAVSNFVSVGFLVCLAYFTTTRERLRGRETLLLVGMFLSASLIPIYGSIRSAIIWPLLMAGVVLFYSGYRLRLRHVGVAVLISLAIMHYMGQFREELRQETLQTADIAYTPDVFDWTSTALLGRHSIELTKMGHVVNNVPHVLERKHGSTIWIWAVAWVPREFWPEKPPIHVGPELGRIYGMKGSGAVPPGFYGEAYWNFGVYGVLFGSALLGILLRWVHNVYQPRNARDMVTISLYSVGVLRLAWGSIVTGFGFGLFNAAMSVAMVVLLLWFLRSPVHTRRYPWRA